MSGRVEQALVDTYGKDAIPTVEDIQDVVETVLMENRKTAIARRYIIYRHKRAMARAAEDYSFQVTDYVPYKKIYDVLRWNMDHECDSVQSLNRIIKRGKLPELAAEADARYQNEINFGVASMLERIDDLRIVIVAGPSSSGKTTTTIKASEQLARAGIRLRAINIDNYFFNLEQHPRDEFGDYDYETPHALDLDLINRHLRQLLDGETIKTPVYDFKTGVRTLDVNEMKLGTDEVLLIDSLHGLYEGMTQSIPAGKKFKLYIETLGQFRTAEGSFMRWADNRLLRRMIRDRDHRNYKPMQTLTHWHYVRKSELKHIIPFIKDADYIVNSALPYELPILKFKLFRYITKAKDAFKDDARRLDAHIRANRVYDLLQPLRGVRNHDFVGDNSLLREFIGGSKYKY
jgi:uridine kinase